MEIDELKVFESAAQIDVSQYEGKRVKIDKLEVIDAFSSYNDEGVFVEGLKRPIKKLKVSTEVLAVIPRLEKEPIELRATVLFGLKKKLDNSGQVVWGVPQHNKSKLFQFLKKQKVNTIAELKGTLVTVTTRPSGNPDDDREYLSFAL